MNFRTVQGSKHVNLVFNENNISTFDRGNDEFLIFSALKCKNFEHNY